MRLVIDMQGAQTESRFRGIGRYALSFAQAIVRNRGEHHVALALSDLFPDSVESIRSAFHGLLPQHDIHVWNAPGPLRESDPGNGERRRVAELIREAFLASLEPDLIHITNFFEGYNDDAVISIGRFDTVTPVSVSLYDLIPLIHPRSYLEHDPGFERYYRRRIEELGRAAVLLAISESSRLEALEQLDDITCEVVNVSTAAAERFAPVSVSDRDAKALKARHGIEGDFVLYTGGIDERKNLKRLIEAFARLPRRLRAKVQLVCAGMMPAPAVNALRAAAASAGLPEGSVLFTGYLSDDSLLALYNLCRVFVFPSWHEGFGLPALEAMQCGAPTIGANASSIPEVIGLDEALFDPFDAASISSVMQMALEDSTFRAMLSAHGRNRARQFSWDSTARKAIATYERLHASRPAHGPRTARERLLPQLLEAVPRCLSADGSGADVTAISRAIARIREPGVARQLLVDVSELSQRDAGTGIQRVTRSILTALLENPPEGFAVKPVYGTLTLPGYRYANSFVSELDTAVTAIEEDLPIDYGAGDVFLGLDLQHDVVRAQHHQLEDLRRNGVFVAFVVYDLLPITMPQAFPPGADSGHTAWLDVITRFDGALCISNAVARELEEWLRAHSPTRLRRLQIRSFPMGADVRAVESGARRPTLRRLPLRAGRADVASSPVARAAEAPTFLAVGTLEPRKGYEQILGAFELLWHRRVAANLVIVGREGWKVETLCERLRSHPQLRERLFWLEGISDAYLEQLYRSCCCLIAASSGEGFGLPLIEAARYRLPIIARDIPIFREVAGDHALYFRGDDPQDLAASLSGWLALHADGRHPASERIRLLTWQDSAQRLMQSVLEIRDEGVVRRERTNGTSARL